MLISTKYIFCLRNFEDVNLTETLFPSTRGARSHCWSRGDPVMLWSLSKLMLPQTITWSLHNGHVGVFRRADATFYYLSSPVDNNIEFSLNLFLLVIALLSDCKSSNETSCRVEPPVRQDRVWCAFVIGKLLELPWFRISRIVDSELPKISKETWNCCSRRVPTRRRKLTMDGNGHHAVLGVLKTSGLGIFRVGPYSNRIA